MTTPGNPPQLPGPPTTRRCQYCTKPAEVFDIDGAWCSPEHRDWDRGSEDTWRRKYGNDLSALWRGGRVEVTQP